jgi:hypothetical protein
VGYKYKANPTLVSDSQPFSRNTSKRPFSWTARSVAWSLLSHLRTTHGQLHRAAVGSPFDDQCRNLTTASRAHHQIENAGGDCRHTRVNSPSVGHDASGNRKPLRPAIRPLLLTKGPERLYGNRSRGSSVWRVCQFRHSRFCNHRIRALWLDLHFPMRPH